MNERWVLFVFRGLVLLTLVASPRLPRCLGADEATQAVKFVITFDRGQDRGQCFGTMFEAVSQDGALVLGAGFPNAYNTRYRADRHAVQFYIRSADGRRDFAFEELPRPSEELVGAYLYERDGTVYSTYGGLKAWNPTPRKWERVNGAGGTQESMRVGNGVLKFGDSRATWNDQAIVDPPSEGSYQLFFYANGHLCFYHVHRGDRPYRPFDSDADGFSRLYACPWTPSQGRVDLGKAATLRLPIVGETTFAWGQLRDQIVTGSNIGGFYVFRNGDWEMLLEPKLGVSYQLYSSLAFRDRLLMGQYPTGRLFAYDGEKLTDQEGWPPVLDGVSDRAREAQTTAIYGGELLVGVWPWGELWRFSPDGPDGRKWNFVRRMFSHPEPSAAIIHPYDVENRGNSPGNLWGQRITSLVPSGADLFISTSAKAPVEWTAASYPFLIPAEKWKSYGKVFRATSAGHLSASTKWTEIPTKLEFIIDEKGVAIYQDGTLAARHPLAGKLGTQVRQLQTLRKITWGSGIYGPHGGVSLTGEVSGLAGAGRP